MSGFWGTGPYSCGRRVFSCFFGKNVRKSIDGGGDRRLLGCFGNWNSLLWASRILEAGPYSCGRTGLGRFLGVKNRCKSIDVGPIRVGFGRFF